MISRKLKKIVRAFLLRRPLWESTRQALWDSEWRDTHGPFLPQVSLESVIEKASELHLIKPHFQDGNVSPIEISAIAALVAARRPKLSFEVGTFDGNTTLQIAPNSVAEGGEF